MLFAVGAAVAWFTSAREGVVMASKNHDYIEHVRVALEQTNIGTGQLVLERH
jgi:hypothetical protein